MNQETKYQSYGIEYILENDLFFHHFQPIMDISTNKRLGLEGLLRCPFTYNPQVLLEDARKSNKLYTLDTLSIGKALQVFNQEMIIDKKQTSLKLFLNVFPSTLSTSSFRNFIDEYLTKMQNIKNDIVLEINELENVNDFNKMKDTAKELQQMGIQIALDDVGVGGSPFEKLFEMQPDYLKLDKYFSNDLHHSHKKQQMMKLFINFCADNNIEVILEGIEKQEDLLVAKDLGIQYVQGFLFGKPGLLNKSGEK